MDVFISPSKIRSKPIEIICIDDSESPNSSIPPIQHNDLLSAQESDSDDFIKESESFISTSDEFIDKSSSFSEDSDVEIQTKGKIISDESSLSTFSSSLNNRIQKKSKIKQNNTNFKIIRNKNTIIEKISSSSDDDLKSDFSSQIIDSSSSISSSQNYTKVKPKSKKFNRFKSHSKATAMKNKNKSSHVDDLDDFIDEDEYDYEEDEMDSSDRRFIASESQVSDDISIYRLCDLAKRPKKSNSKTVNVSSSESDFESSYSST